MRNARQIAEGKVDDRVERELEAERFLTTLFGYYDSESIYKYNVWSIRGKDKVNNWTNNPEQAAEYAIEQSLAGFDVYTGIALFNRIPLGMSRGSRNECSGFAAFVADIDFPKVGGEIRAKEIIRLFEEHTKIKPTIIVGSGSGYHVHYCLKEPYTFDTNTSDSANDGRGLIHSLYTRFIRLYQSIASTIIYEDDKQAKIDSTIGVERVWRIPGTLNRKTESRKPCKMLLCDESQRYSIEEIEEVLPLLEDVQAAEPIERQTLNSSSIIFPYVKWKRLFENNQTFRLLWNRSKRMEQKHGTDDSSYDFALAGIMTRDEMYLWSNEEIAAVLQEHRREHNPNDPKINRVDYYERTIAAIRADNRKTTEREGLLETVHRIAEQEDYVINEFNPVLNEETIDDTAKFDVISRLLGARVTSFVKYEAPNNKHSYEMVINGKVINFPSPDTILSYPKFRQLVFSSINAVLPSKMKLEDWDSIVKTLMSSLTIMSATEDETRSGFFRDIVRAYVRDSVKHELPNYGDVMTSKEGDIYIRVEGLARHMSRRSKAVDTAEIIAQIKELTKTNAVRINVKMFSGNRTTVSAYKIPKEVIEE